MLIWISYGHMHEIEFNTLVHVFNRVHSRIKVHFVATFWDNFLTVFVSAF